jgi:hypothetical protein
VKYTVADLGAFESLASNLIDIREQLTSAGTRLSHFPTDEFILEAATQVFTSILQFLVQSMQFLRAKKPVRTLKALAGANEKLQRIFDDVQQRTASLDRVAGIIGESRECDRENPAPLHYCATVLINR